MAMKLVVNDEGHVVVQGGMPMYIHDDGKEAAFDADAAMKKIGELNTENTDNRHNVTKVKESLEQFMVDGDEGKQVLMDPKAARKAMETVQNLDDKTLIDAGQVETLKAEMSKAFVQKEDELNKAHAAVVKDIQSSIGEKDTTIYDLLVTTRFANSPTIRDKTILPPDIAATYFGKNFKVEGTGRDAQVIGYLGTEKIYSRERPGEVAKFEEALGTVIDNYPMKDSILKATAGGSGEHGSHRRTTGDALKAREELHKLPPGERLQRIHANTEAKKAAGG